MFHNRPSAVPITRASLVFSTVARRVKLVFALYLVLMYIDYCIVFLGVTVRLHGFFCGLMTLNLKAYCVFRMFLRVKKIAGFVPLAKMALPFIDCNKDSLLDAVVVFKVVRKLCVIERSRRTRRRRRVRVRHTEREGHDERGREHHRDDSGTGSKESHRSKHSEQERCSKSGESETERERESLEGRSKEAANGGAAGYEPEFRSIPRRQRRERQEAHSRREIH